MKERGIRRHEETSIAHLLRADPHANREAGALVSSQPAPDIARPFVLGRAMREPTLSQQLEAYYAEKQRVTYTPRLTPAIIYLNAGQLAAAHLNASAMPEFYDALKDEDPELGARMTQQIELPPRAIRYNRVRDNIAHAVLMIDGAGSRLTEEKKLAHLVTGNSENFKPHQVRVVMGGARLNQRFMPLPQPEEVALPEMIQFGPVELFALESLTKQLK